jgi:hypothetical protein
VWGIRWGWLFLVLGSETASLGAVEEQLMVAVFDEGLEPLLD